MPGILMKATNKSSGRGGAKQLLARVRIPLTRASRLTDEQVMNHPDIIQIRNYLESLPIQGRSLEFSIRNTNEEVIEHDPDRQELEEAERIRLLDEARKNMTRYFR